MSKVLTSPIPAFEGTIQLPARLTILQCSEIDKAFGNPNDLLSDNKSERVWYSVSDMRVIPALLACVEKWNIKDFPENLSLENFPATPRAESHKFISWVWSELKDIYFGERNIPNE